MRFEFGFLLLVVMFILLPIVILGLKIAFTIIVFKDAKSRGENAIALAVTAFFSLILFGIYYKKNIIEPYNRINATNPLEATKVFNVLYITIMVITILLVTLPFGILGVVFLGVILLIDYIDTKVGFTLYRDAQTRGEDEMLWLILYALFAPIVILIYSFAIIKGKKITKPLYSEKDDTFVIDDNSLPGIFIAFLALMGICFILPFVIMFIFIFASIAIGIS